MRLASLPAALGSAVLLLSAQPAGATHSHRHVHDLSLKRHSHEHNHEHQHAEVNETQEELRKRGVCSLPDHPDLVRIPGAMNNGFAMSPDQPCTSGDYCPLACVSGKVMNQWKPGTTYKYPESMYGGLLCNHGVLEKPFDSEPYCVDGTKTVYAENDCTDIISFCQTVLPGNEAMLIPTDVMPGTTEVLAVPGPKYWDSTAAHYYINGPGVPSSIGCKWGEPSTPIGNWAAYVAGANTDAAGKTWVKIAWNPVWIDCPLSKVMPTYGIRVECPDGGCTGLPCSIDPTKDGINGVNSQEAGAGDGAKFCVVAVDPGKTANIVVFETNGSKAPSAPPSSSKPLSTAAQPSTSSPPPPPTSSSVSSSSYSKSSSSSSSSSSSTSSSSSSSASPYPTVLPGIFHENSTYSTGAVNKGGSGSSSSSKTTSAGSGSAAAASGPAPTVSKSEGAADQSGGAIAGLIVAIVAAAALY